MPGDHGNRRRGPAQNCFVLATDEMIIMYLLPRNHTFSYSTFEKYSACTLGGGRTRGTVSGSAGGSA
jgi:hypothetical protein